MKRMGKSMRQEISWLLPTPKRLKIIEKRVATRMTDVCLVNNECYELIEMIKDSVGEPNTTHIIMISDNISYISRYIDSMQRMYEELSEALSDIYNLLEHKPQQYIYPILLKRRIKRTLYVNELTRNIHNEMAEICNELRVDFVDLLKEIKANGE